MTTNLPKSSVTKTMTSKSGSDLIWNNATQTWDTMTGTWDVPGQVISNIPKSTVTQSMLSKSTLI